MQKKILVSLLMAGMAFNLGVAQPARRGPGTLPEPQPGWSRPDIPVEVNELRTQVMELRTELDAARNELLSELGPDATQAERIAALAEFHTLYAEKIAEVRVLSQQLADQVRDTRPEPHPIDLPYEIVAKQAELAAARAELQASREAVLAALGEDATDEEIREAMLAWREANTAAVEAVQALAAEIRAWFQENRPERPVRPVTAAMRQRRSDLQAKAVAIRESRQAFAQAMGDPNLTEAERRRLAEDFRAEQRELMQEQRELKRQQRIDAIGVGGDRRPGG